MMRSTSLYMLLCYVCMWGCPSKQSRSNEVRLPHGGGHYLNKENVFKTRFNPIGYLISGEPQTVMGVRLSGREGYEVELSTSKEFSFEMTGAAHEMTLALYGPRDDHGLWGEVLMNTQGKDTLYLSGTVSSAGEYFLLILPHTQQLDEEMTLLFECSECQRTCQTPIVCDLYCSNGYISNPDSDSTCRVCECNDSPCDVVCMEGEVCINGECMMDCDSLCPPDRTPVCGDNGINYPNPCLARCAGIEDFSQGLCVGPPPCDEQSLCPLRSVCEGGLCQPVECECDSERNLRDAVCSQDGQTFPNLCELECVGAELASSGPCPDKPCSLEGECREGEVCLLSRRRDQLRDCFSNGECDHSCYPNQTHLCLLSDPSCPEDMNCVSRFQSSSDEPRDELMGICAPRCGSMNDSVRAPPCPIESPYCYSQYHVCLPLCDMNLRQCPNHMICQAKEDDSTSRAVGICIPQP